MIIKKFINRNDRMSLENGEIPPLVTNGKIVVQWQSNFIYRVLCYHKDMMFYKNSKSGGKEE